MKHFLPPLLKYGSDIWYCLEGEMLPVTYQKSKQLQSDSVNVVNKIHGSSDYITQTWGPEI